ncbi:unnamed protein product [Mytilus coruscus]|uniref:Uncharacterized protein n=1 Tax=Mytilus coruscus TaxID=42192 RepID=A0A6J8CSX3_MYTCO|nr:unnamed protein product [Mytilus coruscus]
MCGNYQPYLRGSEMYHISNHASNNKYICKCIYKYELTSHVEKSPVCIFWEVPEVDIVDKIYSISRNSLPIFKFETDLRTEIIQKGDREHHKHYCLAKRNGDIGYGTWTTAIYNCAVEYTSLVKHNSTYFDYWLRYFMYEEDKGNKQCVAITRDTMFRKLTYQFRPCSDRLPVLCVDESNSQLITPVFGNRGSQFPANSTEPMNPTSSNMPDVQRPEEIVYVNVVLFGLCILFAILIILRKRFTLCVRPTANKKFRRYNINESQMVQTDGNSERNNGVSQN